MVKRMTLKQFVFIIPLLVFIGVFSFYPIITSFMYSLFDYRNNDQSYNGFYISEQFNGSLFQEDCKYVNYFLDADKMLMDETDQAEISAVQEDVTAMMEKYADITDTQKISDSQMTEIQEFNSDIRERIMAVYDSDKYADVEFYNAENMPAILDNLDSTIVTSNFVGLTNYINLVKDGRFWADVGHTLLFTVVSVFFEFILGLCLALIMNQSIRGIGAIRTMGLIPWAIPTAVSAMMWKYMYDGDFGVIAHIFNKLGFIDTQAAMLMTPDGAMASAIIADIWKTTPYMALLLLAGLQVIDSGLYEAASIDGSGKVGTFFRITLPLMKPSIMVALLFRTLDSFRVFDLLTILTGGGPGNGTETLSIYSNKLIFSQSNYGYGSAVVIGMFVCVAIIAFIYMKVLGADVISDKTA